MLKLYAITDIGQTRESNQDGFLVDGIHCENSSHREIYYETDSQYSHVALCDGVGSTIYAIDAVRFAQEYICNNLLINSEEELDMLVRNMNESVYNSLQTVNKPDAACTIAGVIVNDNRVFVYNIGDSIVFSINNGYLDKQTTEDYEDSLFGEQTSSENEMRIKPPLLQSIGTSSLLEQVHIKCLQDCKSFLMCTDGITDLLSLDEIEEIIEKNKNLKDIAKACIKSANEKGGYDNATIIVIEIEG